MDNINKHFKQRADRLFDILVKFGLAVVLLYILGEILFLIFVGVVIYGVAKFLA